MAGLRDWIRKLLSRDFEHDPGIPEVTVHGEPPFDGGGSPVGGGGGPGPGVEKPPVEPPAPPADEPGDAEPDVYPRPLRTFGEGVTRDQACEAAKEKCRAQCEGPQEPEMSRCICKKAIVESGGQLVEGWKCEVDCRCPAVDAGPPVA